MVRAQRRCVRIRGVALALVGICLLSGELLANVVLYSNDFDGGVTNASGTSTSITGGTGTQRGQTGGIVSTQGLSAFSDFSGDFWRVTQRDDVLQFTITGISAHQDASVCFSLAMLDSWDGTSSTYGSDIINFAVFDGATQVAGISEPYAGANAPSAGVESIIVQDQQLGFNYSEPWWHEDAYRMCFDNIPHTGSDLTLQFWASSGGSGTGFQGGSDESFGIDNLVVTATIPEPAAGIAGLVLVVLFARRPTRRSLDSREVFAGTENHDWL